jgi:CDC-like kinase
MICL